MRTNKVIEHIVQKKLTSAADAWKWWSLALNFCTLVWRKFATIAISAPWFAIGRQSCRWHPFSILKWIRIKICNLSLFVCRAHRIITSKATFKLALELIWRPKYSKHWPYTVAHAIDCVCSKISNHGLNHGLFLSLFKFIPCHIHWIVYVFSLSKFQIRILK